MTGREEVFNPVEVEQAIRDTSNRIAKSVDLCGELYEAWLKADREYDHAYARAFLAASGAQGEKRYRAELNTTNLRAVRDTADAAYRLADRRAKALQDELRAWQSVGASVRAMYAVAGRGDF